MNKTRIFQPCFWCLLLVTLSAAPSVFGLQSESDGASALEQATQVSRATGKPLFVVAGAAT